MTRRREKLVSARRAAGFTQESFAAALSVDRSTVGRWECWENEPLPYLWPRMAKLLEVSPAELRAFISLRDEKPAAPELDPAFAWLDRRAGWEAGTARRRAAAAALAPGRRVGRSEAVGKLVRYYGSPPAEHRYYGANLGDVDVATSILCRSSWLEGAFPLTAEHDRLRLRLQGTESARPFDENAAIERLAAVAAGQVRITDVPLYRLVDFEFGADSVRGAVRTASFVEYALGVDRLEGELSENRAGGAMPLRDTYLPDLSHVLDVDGRFCAGGVLALTAIARPADPFRGGRDYVLLVQERSSRVVNGAGRLAVIPKAFHRPLADHRADARIGATLRRELEEELFGRADVDNTAGPQLVADPMHPTRLSEPMRWLTEAPGRLRMECTGFGFNLVSGNYEFASLVVIEDEEFWPRFGGAVEANWEAAGLRLYSTLDDELISELITDELWSNEGLFAFLQGIRRLREIGGKRVALPTVELHS
ncbi:helix-turn-helix transcriptional regulator [Amycolatopsis sp. NPDC005232]|uniref:helix-turn-helix domain-containing protein n=1 Tax=Amycolatopsis sp. NPDC005232 TaxID=3157027 RepID=UPI0033A51831